MLAFFLKWISLNQAHWTANNLASVIHGSTSGKVKCMFIGDLSVKNF